MDWTIVVTTAITAVVGVAGVAGTIINARFAGDSARKSALLNITAEADRARLAEKRRIYARGVGALDTAMLADGAARAAERHAESVEASRGWLQSRVPTAVVEDQHKRAVDFRAKATEALGSANEAASELQLIAEDPAVELARNALDNISNPGVYAGHRAKLLKALRTDLGKEADRAYEPR